MEEINNEIDKLNISEENKYNLDKNPNLIYKGEIVDDCRYDCFQNNFNFDVYNLYSDKEKTFISFICHKENSTIKIIEFSEKENNTILTLKDYKNQIISVKHYFNYINKKDYLLSNDSKGNVLLYEITSINEYKLKQKIESKTVRNKYWTCQTMNQNHLFPGMGKKFGYILKPYNLYNPMKNNIFNMNKMGMFDCGFGFEDQLQLGVQPYVIDYIECTLLFFTSNNAYILVLYRETNSLAIFDLETLESKGRIYDESSVNSLVQWYNSKDDTNYLVISGSNKIEIINPLDKNNKFTFKDNDNLKGGNYAYSILYNFRDNNDYLLSYTKYKINIINLNSKILVSTIEIKNNINYVLPWNKNYLIVSQGEKYRQNNFDKLWIIEIDSKKAVTQISGPNNDSIKGAISRLILPNKKIYLFINNSEKKIELYELNDKLIYI